MVTSFRGNNFISKPLEQEEILNKIFNDSNYVQIKVWECPERAIEFKHVHFRIDGLKIFLRAANSFEGFQMLSAGP